MDKLPIHCYEKNYIYIAYYRNVNSLMMVQYRIISFSSVAFLHVVNTSRWQTIRSLRSREFLYAEGRFNVTD